MSAMPAIPAVELNVMREEHNISWAPPSGTKLDKGRAEQLAEVISESRKVKQVIISGEADDDALHVLAGAIRQHPTLRSVRLKRPEASIEAIRAVIDASLDLPELVDLQMRDTQLDSSTLRHIAQKAGQHPSLSSLCLSKNNVDNSTAEALGEMLEQNRKFHFIRLMDCNISGDAMVKLASHAAKQPEIIHFHLHHNLGNKDAAQAITEHMLAGDAQNLLSCLPYTDKSNRHCVDNSNTARELLTRLAEAQHEGRGETVLCHAQAYKRWSVMHFIGRNKPQIVGMAQQYLSDLPLMDASNDPLKTDDKGLCPAVNPAFWLKAEENLQQIENAGAVIDKKWLQQTTAQGESLLLCALTTAPQTALTALNRRGIRIQTEDLLDAEQQPTPMLQNMITQHNCAALFTAENWRGAKPEEARQTLYALPEEARNRIGNSHQLLAKLSREQQSKAQGR